MAGAVFVPLQTRAADVVCCNAKNQQIIDKGYCQSREGEIRTVITLPSTCGALDPGWVCCETSLAKDKPADAKPDAASKQGSDTKLINPLGANADILTIINRVISSFLGIVGAIALLVFVYGGIVYMTAGGNEKRTSEARSTLVHAAIGLTIIMFAYTITNTFLYVLAG